jgi:DNA-binding phage protein
MTGRLLNEQEVLILLQQEISRSNQCAWARRARVNRTHLNKVLHGARPLGLSIVRALNLRQVIAQGATKREIRARLRRAIKQAGSISAWSRQTGIDRSLVSRVVNGRRKPSPPFLRALNIKQETLYVCQRPQQLVP